MRLPRRREARPVEPSSMINYMHIELQEAKEILAEVFGVRTTDVEEMIRRRLEEISWSEERLWPESFCLGE